MGACRVQCFAACAAFDARQAGQICSIFKMRFVSGWRNVIAIENDYRIELQCLQRIRYAVSRALRCSKACLGKKQPQANTEKRWQYLPIP